MTNMTSMTVAKSMKTATMIERRWRQHHFRAMNTDVHVIHVNTGDDPAGAVEALFRRNERVMSRFDPSSDLSRLNGCRQGGCAVGPTLYAALEVALWAAAATGGIYDPTVLGDLQDAGYDRSFDLLVDRDDFCWQAESNVREKWRIDHRRVHDYRSVTLQPDNRIVRRPSGLGIDLGGMGKGWSVDRSADLMHARGMPFLVNAGGDLYASGAPGNAPGWDIDLEHPLRPGQSVAHVQVKDRALATSTVCRRQWQHHGRRQHHLIDPRTQAPAETDVLSVSVTAQRTVLAEIFAKVALILGAEAGLAYLEQLPGVEGMLFTVDEQTLFTTGFEQ